MAKTYKLSWNLLSDRLFDLVYLLETLLIKLIPTTRYWLENIPVLLLRVIRTSLNKQNNYTAMNKQLITLLALLPLLGSLLFLSSCSKDDSDDNDTSYDVPSTYVFTDADGNSTVSFSGQTDRLNMVSEITAYLKTSDNGAQLDAQQIKDMLRNENDAFSDADLNASTKQIFNKIFLGDQNLFLQYADDIAAASTSTVDGADGTAGVLSNGDKQYLFDENGYEITQLIEKGLMGALMYYQATSIYMGSDKMDVDNSTPETGEYYTAMEHHWDEAFGYFGAPVDFPQSSNAWFWEKYTNGRDGLLGSNTKIMDAFIEGRAAISNDDLTTRDNMISEIRAEWEKVVAGTAIHYVNGGLADIADDVLRNHQLSEAYAFIMALKYNEEASVSTQQVEDWLDLIGDNLYNVSSTDLNTLKDEMATAFGLEDVKDQL